ncbi:MAG TPA: AAA family ATPase [Streptosporangiaceae bacterium]
MIRRLALTNWRAYEHVTLDLEPGTTFIVARNGVGKSSLIEGATWALYGDAGGRPLDAIRLGAASASASVEVVLPGGRTLAITRQLPRRLGRNAMPPVSAVIDGREIPGTQISKAIRDAFGADPAFLARLTMLRGGEQPDADAAALNLREHLCRLFGIDGLQEALTELKTRQRETDHSISQIRQASGASARELAELRARHDQAARLAEDAGHAHTASVGALRGAAQAKREAEAHDAWHKRDQFRLGQLAALSEEICSRFGVPADAGGAASILDRIEATTTRQLDDIRRQRGLLEGRVAGIRAALEELGTSAGQCPVCRRPLSPDESAAARSEHDRELALLIAQLEHLDETAAAAALAAVRGFRRRVAGLAASPAPPARPPGSAKHIAARHAELARAADAAMKLLIERRSAALAAAAAIEDAESRQQARDDLETFGSHALATAAIDALESATATLLDGTVAPLTREISSRWKRLFADRGTITLSGEGVLSRDVNGETLPLRSFSTGEKMTARLLLHLLALDAATQAGFCWIDEPLEHLDPDTRRQVASLLAVTPSTSGVGQILVTTYEEPLVRRITRRMPEQARLVYVRAGSDR